MVKSVLVSTLPGSIPDLQLNVDRKLPQARCSLFYGIAGNPGKAVFIAPFRRLCVNVKKTCWGRRTFPAGGKCNIHKKKMGVNLLSLNTTALEISTNNVPVMTLLAFWSKLLPFLVSFNIFSAHLSQQPPWPGHQFNTMEGQKGLKLDSNILLLVLHVRAALFLHY